MSAWLFPIVISPLVIPGMFWFHSVFVEPWDKATRALENARTFRIQFAITPQEEYDAILMAAVRWEHACDNPGMAALAFMEATNPDTYPETAGKPGEPLGARGEPTRRMINDYLNAPETWAREVTFHQECNTKEKT